MLGRFCGGLSVHYFDCLRHVAWELDVPLRSRLGNPALRNRTLIIFSFALIASHTSSTTRIKLTSAFTNIYSPSGLSALHSATIRFPASWERPTKYARGWRECFANCLRVASPIPLVAPTKTATRCGGRADVIKRLDDWTWERVTIVL